MKSTTKSFQQTLRNTKDSLALNSIKVLLVGNNPMELGQCCRSLMNYRAKKFNIETAFSSEECMKQVLKFKPAAIILDDSVGFMNMVEIAEKLHKDSRYANIPVVVIKNTNYHHATLNDGMTDFIMKDRVLMGELPEIILNAIISKRKKGNKSGNVVPPSFEKRISKLLYAIFSPNKISAS